MQQANIEGVQMLDDKNTGIDHHVITRSPITLYWKSDSFCTIAKLMIHSFSMPDNRHATYFIHDLPVAASWA